jgi:hypothetical protein
MADTTDRLAELCRRHSYYARHRKRCNGPITDNEIAAIDAEILAYRDRVTLTFGDDGITVTLTSPEANAEEEGGDIHGQSD